VFEWYDFYLAGSLAATSAKQLSGVNPTAAFIFTLLGFAAGFAVRPFGAIVFGRLGDLVGRKYTFLVTIVLMGSRPSWSASCPATSIGIARR
jgi:MFS family permease